MAILYHLGRKRISKDHSLPPPFALDDKNLLLFAVGQADDYFSPRLDLFSEQIIDAQGAADDVGEAVGISPFAQPVQTLALRKAQLQIHS